MNNNLIRFIASLGKKALNLCESYGQATLMLCGALLVKPKLNKSLPLLIKQLYIVGVQSLSIIIVSGLFIGMVLSLQGYAILVDYGAQASLGKMVLLSLLRELAPVVSALLFAGRVGSALTAEIGLMKATEQIASLEMMALDPLHRIIAPRFWAAVISLPMLNFIFVVVGILGAKVIGVDWKGIDYGSFWSTMQTSIAFHTDILNSFIKSLIFATSTIIIALFNGYYSQPTSEGLSQSTTNTVVNSSLAILGIDCILTAVMFI